MATPNRHRSHERPAALRRKATPSWLPAFNNGARAVVAFTTHSRSRFSMEALMLLRVALILLVAAAPAWPQSPVIPDRKSTRLNSSHSQISYAVFCLKKKKTNTTRSASNHQQHDLRAHESSYAIQY